MSSMSKGRGLHSKHPIPTLTRSSREGVSYDGNLGRGQGVKLHKTGNRTLFVQSVTGQKRGKCRVEAKLCFHYWKASYYVRDCLLPSIMNGGNSNHHRWNNEAPRRNISNILSKMDYTLWLRIDKKKTTKWWQVQSHYSLQIR